MQFNTQKQQLKEYRRTIREELIMLCKRVFQGIVDYGFCCLLIIALTLGIALGWIKD